jgi:hypothetical protein
VVRMVDCRLVTSKLFPGTRIILDVEIQGTKLHDIPIGTWMPNANALAELYTQTSVEGMVDVLQRTQYKHNQNQNQICSAATSVEEVASVEEKIGGMIESGNFVRSGSAFAGASAGAAAGANNSVQNKSAGKVGKKTTGKKVQEDKSTNNNNHIVNSSSNSSSNNGSNVENNSEINGTDESKNMPSYEEIANSNLIATNRSGLVSGGRSPLSISSCNGGQNDSGLGIDITDVENFLLENGNLTPMSEYSDSKSISNSNSKSNSSSVHTTNATGNSSSLSGSVNAVNMTGTNGTTSVGGVGGSGGIGAGGVSSSTQSQSRVPPRSMSNGRTFMPVALSPVLQRDLGIAPSCNSLGGSLVASSNHPHDYGPGSGRDNIYEQARLAVADNPSVQMGSSSYVPESYVQVLRAGAAYLPVPQTMRTRGTLYIQLDEQHHFEHVNAMLSQITL